MSTRSKRTDLGVRLYLLPVRIVLLLLAIVFGLGVLTLMVEVLAKIIS